MPAQKGKFRHVLALLKALARNSEVSDAVLRSVIAGNIGESAETAYTDADIARTRVLAKQFGWDVDVLLEQVPIEDVQPMNAGQYEAEIRRLWSIVRALQSEVSTLRTHIAIGQEKGKAKHRQRMAQMEAAGVTSVDEAFSLLERLRAHILSHGECHGEDCGDDPSLPTDARLEFLERHSDICTCGVEDVLALIEKSVLTVEGKG